MRLSIIVPILNEGDHLPKLLVHLEYWRKRGCEVILVDGGSHDHSVELVKAAGMEVLHADRGRAAQMNKGARSSGGEILLFLHADTRLPENADTLISRAIGLDNQKWGRFDVLIDSHEPMLGLVSAMINLRSRISGIATGDQAIFIHRDLFFETGGFPDQPLMEDVEISRRLKQHTRPACLSEQAVTSGRRWQQYGIWRTIMLMWRLRWRYWRGVKATRLAELYRS